MSQSEILLSEILEKAKANPSALAVFDLDSTLFHVNPRTMKLLKEFASEEQYQSKYPRATEILGQTRELKETYHVREQIEHLGLHKEDSSFHKELFEYWKKGFFSNDYLQFDEPYTEAVEFTNELHRLGIHIMYLTGRDVERMQLGTEEALRKWKFPMDHSRVDLVLKPKQGLDDALFKVDYLQNLEREHSPIWFFENEPANINLMREKAPHIEIVYFESVHSGKDPEPSEDIPRIRHFRWKRN